MLANPTIQYQLKGRILNRRLGRVQLVQKHNPLAVQLALGNNPLLGRKELGTNPLHRNRILVRILLDDGQTTHINRLKTVKTKINHKIILVSSLTNLIALPHTRRTKHQQRLVNLTAGTNLSS